MANPLYGQNKLDNLLDVIQKDRKTYHFGAPPVVIDADSTVADGVDTNIIEHHYKDGLQLSVSNTGGQTILIPAANTAGMDYSYDAADDEGIQWVMSQNTHKGNVDGDHIDRFTVGSPAFYVELQMSIADVSDTDDCLFGLRKVEAFQAAVDNYDEMAAFNIISGDIKTETILNAGTTTTTDLTSGGGDAAGNWADAGVHILRVSVSQAGAVTYKIDGVEPSSVASFSFDSGEVVTPFFYLLHAASSTAGVVLQKLTVGRQ